jgi:hypothetical protein
MSTAREIEDAILSLPATERDKLLHSIPNLFPELGGGCRLATHRRG